MRVLEPSAPQDKTAPRASGRRLLSVLGPFIGLALVIVLFSLPPVVALD